MSEQQCADGKGETMTSSLIVRLARSSLAVLLLSAASPAFASDWMVVGTEPDPEPHRSVYIMQYGDAWITRRLDEGFDQNPALSSSDPVAALQAHATYTANVLQVFENAGGTNFIHYQVQFQCQAGLVRIPEATAYDRAGKQQKSSAPEWMPVPDNWMGRAEMIACKWKNWEAANAALARATSSSTGKGRSAAPSLESLGMRYLGDYAAWTSVVDAVWTKLWPDATQPVYAKGTPEELDRTKREGLAILAKAEAIAAEHRKWSGIAIKLADKAARQGGKLAGEMSNVGGQTEDQIVARWGVPQSVSDRNGVRQLIYSWQSTESTVEQAPVVVIGSTGNGGVGQIGETTQSRVGTRIIQCHRTLLLQQGGALQTAYRVFDFEVGCN
jgi:hypothetical protein